MGESEARRLAILIIDEEFPWPLNSGKRIRTFSLVRQLARTHAVHYLGYGSDDTRALEPFREQNICCHPVSPRNSRQHGIKFLFNLAFNLLSPLPYIVTSHYTRRFAESLRRVCGSLAPDIILCEWTPYAIYLKGSRIPSIIVAHNIESDIWRRYEENEKNAARRWYIAAQRKKVERFERRCYRWACGATAVTEKDRAQILRSGAPYDVRVVENGVDVDFFAPQPCPVEQETIVFTGSMDWRPNQDAAAYFAREVLFRIREHNPKATCYVVGRTPPRSVYALNEIAGVVVTGTVDDVRPFLARASVIVVPLRIGGGSRLKILEACSMKKAVVSTRIGAEGLRMTDGENILLADTPDELARSILRCMTDEGLRTRLGENGRKLVERSYSWQQIAAGYEAYIRKVAEQR